MSDADHYRGETVVLNLKGQNAKARADALVMGDLAAWMS